MTTGDTWLLSMCFHWIPGNLPGITDSSFVEFVSCRGRLDKQGFRKRDVAGEGETRHKNSVKGDDQGTNTAPRGRSRT